MRKYASLLLPAALAGILAVSACGTEDVQPPEETAETATEADFNDADVEFAQMMVVHHEQALKMSELAESRAEDPQVTGLAERINEAQGPEIEQLNTMLDDWGQPSSSEEMTGHAMPGMMTQEQMIELENAGGASFDTQFLEMMIMHHEGAVEMAQEHLEAGANPEARELSQEVVDAQESEIEEMRGLLGQPVSDDSASEEEEEATHH